MSLHNYHCYFSLHTYVNKKGQQQIYLFSRVNRKLSRIPLGIYVQKKEFDFKKELVKRSNKNHIAYNQMLNGYKSKALHLFTTAISSDTPLSKNRFEFLFESQAYGKDFVIFFRDRIRKEAEKFVDGTTNNHMKAYKLFIKFRPKVIFADINLAFIEEFDLFLKAQIVSTGKNAGRPYSQNYVSTIHKQVKKFVSLGIEELDINMKNPYNKFKLIFMDPELDFLDNEELLVLYDIYQNHKLPEALYESLRQFLFMCATGFRISDVGEFTDKNLKDGMINVRIQKTKRYKLNEKFPLSEFAKRFWIEKEGRQFKYKTSQTLNRNLKILAELAGIDKHITTHTGRRSFASNFIASGGNIVVLSKLLGHRKMETTMKYVKTIKKQEKIELGKFDEFINF